MIIKTGCCVGRLRETGIGILVGVRGKSLACLRIGFVIVTRCVLGYGSGELFHCSRGRRRPVGCRGRCG